MIDGTFSFVKGLISATASEHAVERLGVGSWRRAGRAQRLLRDFHATL